VTLEKLVRDRIPELMREVGAVGRFRVAEPTERLKLLLAKLIEEAAELEREPGPGELADVVEVLRAIKGALGLSDADVENERTRKERARGGFRDGFVLLLNDMEQSERELP
jgi:predicted house-cleaning noncanonical NTP pyrophosphatase (MazG superfamily)